MRTLRSIALGTLALGATLTLTSQAHAIELVRVSRFGYVLVDEENAVTPYEGRVPVASTTDTLAFLGQVTELIANTPDAPRARFIAVLQQRRDYSVATAFYMPIKNTVRGIGQRQGGRETWDLNPTAGTAFPLLGFVWLNAWTLFSDSNDYMVKFVCPQEFGHRWGPQVLVPPVPMGDRTPVMDAGADASDASAENDASAESDGSDASADGDSSDASESDGSDAAVSADADADAGAPAAMPIEPSLMLGRDRAHWSFFVHSGGSPLEGNNWVETEPGTFRALDPTFRFSHLDLYLMGVLAPEDVEPSFVIAEPDLLGRTGNFGTPYTPSTGPVRADENLVIRGRRVNISAQDIIRANGARNPPAVTIAPTIGEDGAVIGDASVDFFGEPRENDIDVIWVMLTTRDRVRESDVRAFDNAAEACSNAYAYSSQGRSLLIARRAPTTDAGPQDSGVPVRDSGVRTDAMASDGDVGAEGGALGGGCACRAGAPERSRSGGAVIGWALAAAVARAASRRKRHSRAVQTR